MSLKAKMFNRKAADPSYKPDKVIQVISIQPGMTIADIGSGGGYYSMRFADEVGEMGKVYAVDTSKELLDFIDGETSSSDIKNIVTVYSNESKMDIPERSIDRVFMRNVAHHISERPEYFRKLKRYLKPGGRVAIIDYKGQRKRLFWRRSSHYVTRETLVEELADAGYCIEEEFGFLEKQNFIIFAPE